MPTSLKSTPRYASKNSRLRQLAAVATMAIVATTSLPTSASIIADTFGPGGTHGGLSFVSFGAYSFFDLYFSFGFSNNSSSAIRFDVLDKNYTLDSITLPAEFNSTSQATPVNVSIYTDSADMPSQLLESLQTNSYGGTSPINFSGTTTLLKGNHYWIVSELVSYTSGNQSYNFYGGDRDVLSRNANDSNGGASFDWSQSSVSFNSIAFRVEGTAIAAAVPEPETYAMLLAGLGVVGMMGRRRNGKKAA